MAQPLKQIIYNFTAHYQDTETYQQSLINHIHHYNFLDDVVDYTNLNKNLSGSEIYEYKKQNFLFVVGNIDFILTIDGKPFTLREMVLIQKNLTFDLKIELTQAAMPCTLNFHILHGTLKPINLIPNS